MVENFAREPRQQTALLGRREPSPRAVARALGRLHRLIDVGRRTRRNGRERLAVRRVDHRQGRAGSRGDRAIVDEVRG